MKKVIVAPLDWGLGHATRCIPIIKILVESECEVMIAGAGDSLELLKKEFPQLLVLELPAYDPQYPANGSMVWKMALQLPHFSSVIRGEHKQLEQLVQANKIDIVISDNRFGCWSKNAHSVFITHQSNILMPKRFGWLASLVRKLNTRMMEKFNVCWIPDDPNSTLAGALTSFGTHSAKVPLNYIGHLSRFREKHTRPIIYDVTVILSGPEPQRSIFEKIVTAQLVASDLRYFIVRGLPSEKYPPPLDNAVNFLNSEELQHLIESSSMIVSRSGFSSVMDMMALNNKVVFVPTPGQTEQEYLALSLREKKIAFSMEQKVFNLQTALTEAASYTGFVNQNEENDLLKAAIKKMLNAQ